MKCLQCGCEMTVKRENYSYRECGLPITLVNIEVSRCPSCGEHEVEIPNIQGLHRLIAETVARKKSTLTPNEMRFLRKYIGFSGVSFAEFIGVHAETVCRWETGKNTGPMAIERLLRHLTLSGYRVGSYPERIETPKRVSPLRAKLEVIQGRWAEPAYV